MSGRALVIGLDGMPRSLLFHLAEQGVVPHLAELLGQGHCAELRAPVPEISSTSWASFLTGTNPARHGIFGFTDLTGTGYDTYFPNLTALREPTLWQHAARAGHDTICLNVPGTYPAPSDEGVVVSGFVAPAFESAVRPARVGDVLTRFGYELDVEVGDVPADPSAFIGRATRALLARTAATEHLLATEKWQLAVAVITETDRVQHFLWRYVADEDHPLHPELIEFYRRVDESVGRLVAAIDPDDELFFVSDHGFGPADHQFYVNAWLRDAGWLAHLGDTPQLAALDERSTAFALDPARIYLNRESRFPGGGVPDGSAADLADQIAEELLDVRHEGQPVVADVHRKEDVYEGPLFARAPDLIAVPAPGIQLRGAWGGEEIFRPDVLTGTHNRRDAVFYRRGSAAPADGAVTLVDMHDVAPTVLDALGVHPRGLDGSPSLPAAVPA